MPDISSLPPYLVHYRAGKLTAAALPGGAQHYTVFSVSHVPGTEHALAGGYAASSPVSAAPWLNPKSPQVTHGRARG
jgi:hypothetical protein